MSKQIITKLNVRFSECDYYQHVNNAEYINYLDIGVADLFRKIYDDIVNMNFVIHMVHVSADFKGSATFDDELIITTEIDKIGNTSITFKQSIKNTKTDKIIVEAKKIGVFLSVTSGEKINTPEEIVIFFNS